MTFIIWIVVSVALAAQNPPAASQRFDYLVRADFFAGVAGDEARLNKAIELCEHTLEQNPAHAEALVWHGASLLVRASQAGIVVTAGNAAAEIDRVLTAGPRQTVAEAHQALGRQFALGVHGSSENHG